jgi:hypothetical protein
MADNESDSEEEYIPKAGAIWEYNESHPESKVEIEKQTVQFENQMDSLLQDLDDTTVSFPDNPPEDAENQQSADDLVDTAVNAIATQLEHLAVLLNKARDNIDRKNTESNQAAVEIISETPGTPERGSKHLIFSLTTIENPQDVLKEYAKILWTVNQTDISEEEQETLLDQADLYMTEHKDDLDLNFQYTSASGLSDVGLDLLHISIECTNIDWVILLIKVIIFIVF